MIRWSTAPATRRDGARTRLPAFLVIGAPKCGTTTLAARLGARPDVFVPVQKELRFFDEHWDRGLAWYLSHFATAGEAQVLGEATPTYMYSAAALDRIADTLPGVRLVAILRNPVDRAYSHYWHVRGFKAEPRSFEQAAADELGGTPGPVEPGYLAAGDYLPHLRRAAAAVGRDGLEVLLLDNLRSDGDAALDRVARFLGLDPALATVEPGRAENAAFRYRSMRVRRQMLAWHAWRNAPRLATAVDRLNRRPLVYPRLDEELRARLVAQFARPNAELAEWLGRDLSHWSR